MLLRLLLIRRYLTNESIPSSSSSISTSLFEYFREKLKNLRKETLERIEEQKQQQNILEQAKQDLIKERQNQRELLKTSRKRELEEKTRFLQETQVKQLQIKGAEKEQRSQTLLKEKQQQYQSMIQLLDVETPNFVTRATLNDRIYYALTHPTQFQIPLEALKHRKTDM